MKARVVAVLSMACLPSVSFAEEAESVSSEREQELPVEVYNYKMHPDVHKVISTEGDYNACGLVPIHMIYEDSKGERHDLKYTVMGSGCSNG
ncbi:uncharacterized protein DUF2790 [Azomonas agilis]|uniref:Uncharacterized protein DUF2790 n=1 Tax=Azomonas agilis TaxID=116849 RepID=A0A562I0W7_9GAMM|nr:DUF2790 domain-containing protein [Azomonas agilis]TWH64687.1 uncharacterized protein DUF2790 [Azomonas agilis]